MQLSPQHDNSRVRRLLKALVFGVAECGVILAIAVFARAGHIRALPVGQTVDVGLGPVHFFSLIKEAAANGGYAVSVSPRASLAVLLGLCLAFELCIMWKFYRPPKGDDADENEST